jgi:cytochrome b subunit of formate dehydrogenase
MEFFGDIFGGFMVMLFILGFFLVVLWFILPFVIFAMKGKLDSAHLLLENIDRRLAEIEKEQRLPGRPQQEAGVRHDGSS